MSPPANAPKITSPSAPVRSNNASHNPGHAALQPYPLDPPAVTPKSLSQTGRSKTAPLALEQLWTPSVDRPQLSERDSIFATTYLASDSPASSPQLSALQEGPNDNVPDHGLSDMAVSASTPRRLIPSPVLRQHGPAKTTSTLKEHQGLLTTHFNSSRHSVDMDSIRARQSPPPFMSPVDSPAYRPSTPHRPDSQSSSKSLLDALAESEERLRYRSWREGNAEFPQRHTETQRLREGTHVDKKIEATLPKAEQPAAPRSRKASHYLRVFKENDAAEEQKRREGRARERRPTDKALQTHHEEVAAKYSISRSSSTVPTPQTGPDESYFEQIPTSANYAHKDHMSNIQKEAASGTDIPYRHELPLRLLEEIRSFGNLTPGADRGSSFSKSLPTAAVEKLVKSRPTSEVHESSGYFQAARDESQGHSPASDEDDSEKEHISSALYFPHRQLQSPDQMPQEEEDRKAHIESVRERKSVSAGVKPKGWSTKEAVKTPQEVEISLQSQDTNQCLHGDMSTTTSVPQEVEKPLTSPPDATTSAESDYESLGESQSLPDYESSATDDLGITPTAKLPRKETKPTATTQELAPLGAVELKPYDHQVGGHTTVYRFSRRAVCKQLNNRENEFYETVERHHPELLEFLPRYIGVLNVTYRKAPKKKKTKDKSKGDAGNSEQATLSNIEDTSRQDSERPSHNGNAEDHPRVVSHSQQSTAVPQVVFENNRHIIPDNLFRVPPRSSTPDPWTGNSLPSQYHRRNQSDIGLSSEKSPSRPPMHQHTSWGVTTINTKLQEEVLRQVFAPPVIHHRHRHAHHQHNHQGPIPRKLRADSKGIAASAPSMRRNSTDISELQIPFNEESTRKQVLKSEAQRHAFPGSINHMISDELRPPPAAVLSRRRHSGSGLTRRPCSIDSNRRHNLEFYEEEGYGGDGEDELFAMDEDRNALADVISHSSDQTWRDSRKIAHKPNDASSIGTVLEAPVTPKAKTAVPQFQEPAYHQQVQQQSDERVQHFLLLEDLTAGMSNPCVLDLKMGTRQYGIEADEKKQRSQRRKCQMTTSRELGVRVCGMQIWNVKTQSYVFEDKYFGRDLKAGKEFQDALKRFFYDGIGYKAAIRHIPVILEKISALEGMIRNLPGYRFYASSLLMLYDRGDGVDKDREPAAFLNGTSNSSTEDISAATSPGVGGPTSNPISTMNAKKQSEIKLKIVDFANCVTAEDALPESVPCPPKDPDGVDRGYLRGLRSLRLYFQRIWRDINEKEWVERGEGEGMAIDTRGPGLGEVGKAWMDAPGGEDPGNVSV